ncbi:MAG: DUF4159 domain-containing protein [Pirellulales bacterium]|nr:DUF4159 domain-containing protein [Pirellulales bacterium]
MALLVWMIGGTALPPLHAQQEVAKGPVDAVQIRTAMDKGVEFLRRSQNNDGTWDGHPEQPGGVTALCTLAMLNCGVPASDLQVAKALAHLRTKTPEKVYASALIIMAFAAADPKQDAATIKKHALWLQENQAKNENTRGAWAYDRPTGRPDNSNSQFALLGLYEATRADVGVNISPATWKNSLDYWKKSQNEDGSWGYIFDKLVHGRTVPGTGSMTCAGIASLLIAQSMVEQGDAKIQGDNIICCGNQELDEGVESGLRWMGRHFTVRFNPANFSGAGVGWNMYYLYGIERIGRLSGRRFFYGNQGQAHDWYREGAEHLVRTQNVGGSWSGGNDNEGNPPVSTSLALLYLSKGRRPVLLAKAKFGSGNSWNRHRDDVANLTTYVEQEWKADYPIGLSWQVVDLERATVEDLLQSPVLFLSGSEAHEFAPATVQLLRDYIDRGGFIFAEACCPGGGDFDRSFRRAIQQMFADKPEHTLKLLGPEHAIWRAEKSIPPDALRPLWGVDYGCRTCIVYVPPRAADDPPGNLGCWWEINTLRKQLNFTEKTKKQWQGAYGIGLNVLAYATNRELKSKDQNLNLELTGKKVDSGDRALVYLAKLKHPGGCDTAPGALPGILRAAEQQLGFRVEVDSRLIDITGESIFDHHLVFMHGRNDFRLTPNERKRIREYIERGGTLFADAICSSPAFADSFRQEMREIFPQGKIEPIPPTHPLWTNKYGGFDLSKVVRRDPQNAADQPLEARKQVGPPELEGVMVGDRFGVIFSKYDLSCALERHDSLECAGYSREDAERISLNVLLYSLVQ